MTEHWLITPAGQAPLRGTQIFVTGMTREDRYTPGWAIVLAIIGFFFFFSQPPLPSGEGDLHQRGGRTNQLYELQNRANFARGVIARA